MEGAHRQGTGGEGSASWLVWVERPKTNKAAFAALPSVPAWLAGTPNKKRFPVPFKKLIVAPLCLRRSVFIHKVKGLIGYRAFGGWFDAVHFDAGGGPRSGFL